LGRVTIWSGLRQSISEGIGGKINAYKIQKKIVHPGVRDERMWLEKGNAGNVIALQRTERFCVQM
jgi:hypothetical protein